MVIGNSDPFNVITFLCDYLLDPAHLQVVSALHGFGVLLAPPLCCPHLNLGGLDELYGFA